MNMKFTRILTMLLVLTVSASFTSCDEFLAIFDDPVETPDPVTPPEPEEELLSDLSSALEEGAIISFTYTIDDVEYTSTFKRVGDEFIMLSTTSASARSQTRTDWILDDSNTIKGLGGTVEYNDLEMALRFYARQNNFAKLDVNMSVATCQQVTNYASSEGTALKMVLINGIKANTQEKNTESTKIWLKGAAAENSNVLLGVLYYTKDSDWNKVYKNSVKNGSRYLQIDAPNNHVVFSVNDHSGYLVYGDGEDVKPTDKVGEKSGVTNAKYYLKEKRSGEISFSKSVDSQTWSATAADNTYQLAATVTGDGTVTYSVNDDNTCGATIDAATGVVTFLTAGSVTVSATVADSETYTYATKTVTYTLTVNKAAGSISFEVETVTKKNSDSAFMSDLTIVGDGTVTYSSSDSSVATVNSASGEVTIVGPGTITITATVADGTNYTYSPNYTQYTLTVKSPNSVGPSGGYGEGGDPINN